MWNNAHSSPALFANHLINWYPDLSQEMFEDFEEVKKKHGSPSLPTCLARL
jgi:hypothetical protein